MMQFVGMLFFVLAAIVAGVVAWQHFTGRCHIVSIRNIAILGFIIFQLTGSGLHLINENFDRFPLNSPVSSGLTLLAYAVVFLVIAFYAYDKGWGVRRFSHRLARGKGSASASFLLVMAVLLTFASLALRFAVAIPVISIIASMVGLGFAAVASGLVGWVWARQLFNPVVIAFVVFLVAVNVIAVMWGAFGRRGIVAVFGALLWGMYYSHWRHLPLKALVFRMAAIGLIPLIFVAVFTSVRTSREKRDSVAHLQEMRGGSIKEGLYLLFEGQGTGLIAMWTIEQFPETFEPRPLFSIMYFGGVAVPRVLWPDKPDPLSTKIAGYARLRGVDRGHIKLPAGILGTAAGEGGWYALIIYAVLSGLFLRFFDELLRTNPASPFVVLPVGCQLGQVLGLARGETSVFANTYVLSFIGVWVSMMVIARALDWFGMSRAEEEHEYTELDAHQGDGEDEHWEEETDAA